MGTPLALNALFSWTYEVELPRPKSEKHLVKKSPRPIGRTVKEWTKKLHNIEPLCQEFGLEFHKDAINVQHRTKLTRRDLIEVIRCSIKKYGSIEGLLEDQAKKKVLLTNKLAEKELIFAGVPNRLALLNAGLGELGYPPLVQFEHEDGKPMGKASCQFIEHDLWICFDALLHPFDRERGQGKLRKKCQDYVLHAKPTLPTVLKAFPRGGCHLFREVIRINELSGKDYYAFVTSWPGGSHGRSLALFRRCAHLFFQPRTGGHLKWFGQTVSKERWDMHLQAILTADADNSLFCQRADHSVLLFSEDLSEPPRLIFVRFDVEVQMDIFTPLHIKLARSISNQLSGGAKVSWGPSHWQTFVFHGPSSRVCPNNKN